MLEAIEGVGGGVWEGGFVVDELRYLVGGVVVGFDSCELRCGIWQL